MHDWIQQLPARADLLEWIEELAELDEPTARELRRFLRWRRRPGASSTISYNFV